MGVKHSKQSVDISSTPKKAGAPVEEVNGKTVDEKVEANTKVIYSSRNDIQQHFITNS